MTSPEASEATSLPVPAWVVGGSGLLGSAVRRALHTERIPVLTSSVPWTDPDAAVEVLLRDAERLPEDGWWLAWCAGSAVVASSPDAVEGELRVIREFLDRWQPSPGAPGSRAIFLASSAGAVYAGSEEPPFTEETPPAPVSPYGHAKLEAEGLFTAFGRRTGTPVLLGRLSNLFGPGQDLTKPQGLVSQLCGAQLTGRPLSLYVPLDTMRDYLYVDDAGWMVVAGLRAVAQRGGVHVKVMASGRSMTISEVVGEIRRVTRRRPPVVTQPSPNARYQVHDLRVRSVSWPDLDGEVRTTFGAGIGACLAAVNASLRCPTEGS